MPPKENRQLHQKSLKKKIIRYHSHLQEQKNLLLSEARSEMNVQELRVEIADRALREASLQLHSQRMELYQANQSSDLSRREKGLSLYRIGGVRKSSSRNMYGKSSGLEELKSYVVQKLKERKS